MVCYVRVCVFSLMGVCVDTHMSIGFKEYVPKREWGTGRQLFAIFLHHDVFEVSTINI